MFGFIQPITSLDPGATNDLNGYDTGKNLVECRFLTTEYYKSHKDS